MAVVERLSTIVSVLEICAVVNPAALVPMSANVDVEMCAITHGDTYDRPIEVR